jgi:hypothetical protein
MIGLKQNNLLSGLAIILASFFLILIADNSNAQDNGIGKPRFSIEGGTAFNEDFFYLGSDLSILALAKQDVYLVLSGYFNPTVRKVLHQQSSDVYLLYSEYRIWGGLGFQKNFPINRTITFFARAQAGWGWINYAGSNKDFNDPVAPILTGGLQFNFPLNDGGPSQIMVKTAYQYLRFGTLDSHLAYITIGVGF